MNQFLTSAEIDRRVAWPIGRAERLARRGRLPHIVLPDGAVRFDWETIRRLIVRKDNVTTTDQSEVNANG